MDVITLDVRTDWANGVGTQIGKPLPPLDVLRRDAHTDEVARQLIRRFVRELDEGFVANECSSSGVVEDERELRRGEPPVDRHRNRAQMVRGEDRLEELGAVVREDADDVAGPHAAFVEPGSQPG